MSKLTAAIAGTGFMGPAHLEGLRRLGVEVLGIVGSSEEKSQRAAKQLGIPKAYPDFNALLSDHDVNVVHVTTPNRHHFDMAGAALKAGKHVLCEKPLAMTSSESEQLVRIAKDSGCAAGVNYNIRFYPLCLEAREKVRTGAIGEVFSIHGSYVQDWLLYPTDYNWRVLAEAGGELRAIADIGTHWLDLIRSIGGLEIEAVFADLKTVHPIRQRPKGEVETFSAKLGQLQPTEPVEITTEDCGSVLIRFQGGSQGSLWVSQTTAGRKNCLRFEIAGSQGSLAWCSEQPNDLWIGNRNEPNASLIKDPGLVSETSRAFTSYPGGHNEGFPDTFKQCFKAFYDAIEAGEFSESAFFPTFEDGHQEILLCEAILKSHQQQQWIKP